MVLLASEVLRAKLCAVAYRCFLEVDDKNERVFIAVKLLTVNAVHLRGRARVNAG